MDQHEGKESCWFIEPFFSRSFILSSYPGLTAKKVFPLARSAPWGTSPVSPPRYLLYDIH